MWSGPDRSLIEELSAALSDIERGVLSMSRTADVVDELVKKVEETLVSNSHIIDKDVFVLSEVSDNLKGFVEELKPIAKQMAQLSSEYNSLLQNLEQIKNFLSGIEEIAGHIELIAINAAIEAARAGESGRNFAVVANEIRRMAKKTFQFLNEIKELDRNIEPKLKSLRSSVEGMNKLTNRLDELIEDINRVISISNELDKVNKVQTKVVSELKGLSGVSVAIDKINKILSHTRRKLASAFKRIL